MSNPTNPERPTPASRAPKSGRKYIDPTKYQMDTVPTELVAKIAELRNQPLPQAVLHPPPLFDERPIIGRLRRAGEWIARRRKWLTIGCFVGLCVVITTTVMMSGKTTARSDEARGTSTVRAIAAHGSIEAKTPKAGVDDVSSSAAVPTTSSMATPSSTAASQATQTGPSIKTNAEVGTAHKATGHEPATTKSKTTKSAMNPEKLPVKPKNNGDDDLFMKDY